MIVSRPCGQCGLSKLREQRLKALQSISFLQKSKLLGHARFTVTALMRHNPISTPPTALDQNPVSLRFLAHWRRKSVCVKSRSRIRVHRPLVRTQPFEIRRRPYEANLPLRLDRPPLIWPVHVYAIFADMNVSALGPSGDFLDILRHMHGSKTNKVMFFMSAQSVFGSVEVVAESHSRPTGFGPNVIPCAEAT